MINTPFIVPGPQPGETWEEFQERASAAVFGPPPEVVTPEPGLITFLRRRAERHAALGISTHKHWCKGLDSGTCPHGL